MIVYLFLNALQISGNIATHYHAYSNPNLYNTIVSCLIIIILSYLAFLLFFLGTGKNSRGFPGAKSNIPNLFVT